MSIAPFFGRILWAMMVWSAVSAAPAVGQNSNSRQQRYEHALAALHQRMQPLKQAYQAIDWPADSPQAIGKLLRGDPQACAAFLRERMRYEPYQGILRGPAGALAAGGGNSADLALLLSQMISSVDSAPKIQFIVAQLTDEQAAALVTRAIMQPSATTVVAGGSAEQGLSTGSAVQLEAPAKEDFLAAARLDLEQLGPMLKDVDCFDAERRSALKAAHTHVWLQVQRSGGWTVLDPTGNLPVPAIGAQVMDRLPEDWNCRVSVSVEVERLLDGKLNREVVMQGQWTAAALDGRALELEIIPTQLSLPAMFDGKESSGLLQQAQAFNNFDVAMSLSGAEPTTGKSFDLNGAAATPDKGEIGRQVNPFGAFHRLGEAPAAVTQLSGVWLTITAGLPGENPRRIERALLDRIGPAGRAGGTLAIADAWKTLQRVRVALFQRHQILIGGNFSEHRLARDVLDCIVNGPTLEQALAIKYGQAAGSMSQSISDLDLPALPFDLIALQRIPAALAQASIAGQGVAFAAAPQVFIHSQTFDVRGGSDLIARDDLDIAEDDLAFLAAPGAARDGALLHGLWASELEGQLLERRSPSAVHAAGIVRAAARQGIALRQLRTLDDLKSIDADADSKAFMARQLTEGCILVAPASAVKLNNVPRFAWWRIDPNGQLLAIGADGRGQASEGLMVLKKISIPMVKRCMKFVYCFNKAVAGGGGMNESAAECLSESIKEVVKESLDAAIDTFIVDPIKEKVSAARKGMLGEEYNKLYEDAKKTYANYQKAQSAIADPAGSVPGVNEGRGAAKGGRAIGDALGWRLYLLMNNGQEITQYASQL